MQQGSAGAPFRLHWQVRVDLETSNENNEASGNRVIQDPSEGTSHILPGEERSDGTHDSCHDM